MSKRNCSIIVALMICILAISGCADVNPLKKTQDSVGDCAGFWFGLWNGLTFLLSLIGSIFFNINVYEVHNNGLPYNVGFGFGICIPFFILMLKLFNHNEKQPPVTPKQ
ncbi:hypothetical protein KW782_03695 [Candidatus Parcubacteria bacterium]|nr:hypothetical protein [Candidatus Parcubacteria bacterium]